MTSTNSDRMTVLLIYALTSHPSTGVDESLSRFAEYFDGSSRAGSVRRNEKNAKKGG